jgi:murein DD-endopeptidase MepM/ murein hydrolase activator NlpD
MKLRSFLLVAVLIALIIPASVSAAPIAPEISIIVNPEMLVPAQAGYVYVAGAYPLDISMTLDGQPLEVFWTGSAYQAVFAFGFDEPPGDHALGIVVDNSLTGEHIEQARTVSVQNFAYPTESVALPNNLIPLLDNELNQRELDRLGQIYLGRSYPATWDWPFSIPVPGGVVTSRFGGDRTYNGGMLRAHHTGMDFRRTEGEPVYATAAGRVATAELFDVRGNVVIIDHGYGVFSQYAHLSQFFVALGEYVEGGQLLGMAGKTGRTNGPHLHFEVIVKGITVDPLRWLSLVPNFVAPREVNPDDESGG